MASSPNYKRDYEAAKNELVEVLAKQEKLERRKLDLRKEIELLAALCEAKGIAVQPSQEALFLLETSSLAEEVCTVLKGNYPIWLTPHSIKGVLEHLGRDLGKYQNAQATIQTILKRLVDSGDAEEQETSDGKKAYRCPTTVANIVEACKSEIISANTAGSMIRALSRRK